MRQVSFLALLFGPALAFASHSFAQTSLPGGGAQPPIGAHIIQRPTFSIVVPASNFQLPAEAGKTSHTNTRYILPQGLTGRPQGASPLTGPPFSGTGVETPASLACLYGLAPVTAGCNPNSVTAVATGGSRAIALVDAYDYPTALADLQTYSTQFGLPAPVLRNADGDLL